jgi:hypothetical protein
MAGPILSDLYTSSCDPRLRHMNINADTISALGPAVNFSPAAQKGE